jgi:hypothetical protein
MTNITVTNTYQDAGGAAPSGTVSFTPVLSATGGSSFTILADPIMAPVVAGVLSVSLLTTDTFQVDGTVTYRVVERVGATKRSRFYVAIPSSLGSSVVLSSLAATSTPPNTFVIEGGGDLDAALDALDARIVVLEAEAAGGLAAHEAAADPHADYLQQAETDLLYEPIGYGIPTGGTIGQVLAKDSSTARDVSWVNQAATAITSPFTVTADAISETPITAQGMAGQTADVFAAKLNGGTGALAVAATGQVKVGNAPPTAGTVRIEQKSASEAGIVVKLQSTPTADAIAVTDNGGTVLMSVEPDGQVVAPNIGVKVIVLDNAAAVPGGTLAGTVILRRPA